MSDDAGDTPVAATDAQIAAESAALIRRLAINAFNEAWSFVERADRSPQDDQQMLLAAGASRYLWAMVGGAEQLAVGDWQIAHVASLAGNVGLGRMFAVSSLAIVEANGWTDWRYASALEAMARVAALSGAPTERDGYAARCREVLATIDDAEDRDLIASQLASIPGIDSPG